MLNDLKSKTKKVKHFKDAMNQVWAWQLQSIGGKSPTFWKTIFKLFTDNSTLFFKQEGKLLGGGYVIKLIKSLFKKKSWPYNKRFWSEYRYIDFKIKQNI